MYIDLAVVCIVVFPYHACFPSNLNYMQKQITNLKLSQDPTATTKVKKYDAEIPDNKVTNITKQHRARLCI